MHKMGEFCVNCTCRTIQNADYCIECLYYIFHQVVPTCDRCHKILNRCRIYMCMYCDKKICGTLSSSCSVIHSLYTRFSVCIECADANEDSVTCAKCLMCLKLSKFKKSMPMYDCYKIICDTCCES
jgi:hypothetical protein